MRVAKSVVALARINITDQAILTNVVHNIVWYTLLYYSKVVEISFIENHQCISISVLNTILYV